MEGQVGLEYFMDEERATLKPLVLGTKDSRWKILFARMEELVEGLDQEAFKTLEDREIWERAKGQARCKFE